MSPWLRFHLRLGLGLGLLFGVGGELWLLGSGEARPLWHGLSALSNLSGFVANALLLGALLGLAPGVGRPRLRRLLSAGAQAGLAVLHGAAVAVHVQAGSYPSPAALQMLLASPVQFLGQAMESYAGALLALPLGAALLGALLYRSLADTTPSAPGRADALTVVAALGLHLGCLGLGLGVQGPAYLHATPESSLLAHLLQPQGSGLSEEPRDSPQAASLAPLPRAAPERSAVREWQAAVAAHSGPRPDVILIMLESVPAEHTGFAGYKRQVTPRLDAVAKQSLRATRMWSTATQSNYAQMAILSSLHPRRGEHLDDYSTLDYPRVLPHDVFHRLGYATATISSQNEAWLGMKRFQTTDTPTTFLDAPTHPGPHIGKGLERKLPDHITVDRALQWIEELPGSTPFSLYLNLQRTHFPYEMPKGQPRPYQPDEPTAETFGYLGYPLKERQAVLNRYDNALRYVDAQVGRLLDGLSARGSLDETLLVVVADHGESFLEHGEATHGSSLHDTQARVPMLLRWPDRVPARELHTPLSTLDIMPTVLELLGLPPHPAYQGRSFARPAERGVQDGGIFLTLQGLRYADAVVCWPFKLIHESNTAQFTLYDLEHDADERFNIFRRDHPAARPLAETLLAHVNAQLGYYRDAQARQRSFAPRLRGCPTVQR